jgi:hypothetical protein
VCIPVMVNSSWGCASPLNHVPEGEVAVYVMAFPFNFHQLRT